MLRFRAQRNVWYTAGGSGEIKIGDVCLVNGNSASLHARNGPCAYWRSVETEISRCTCLTPSFSKRSPRGSSKALIEFARTS